VYTPSTHNQIFDHVLLLTQNHAPTLVPFLFFHVTHLKLAAANHQHVPSFDLADAPETCITTWTPDVLPSVDGNLCLDDQINQLVYATLSACLRYLTHLVRALYRSNKIDLLPPPLKIRIHENLLAASANRALTLLFRSSRHRFQSCDNAASDLLNLYSRFSRSSFPHRIPTTRPGAKHDNHDSI
jgi:hypothetical protein